MTCTLNVKCSCDRLPIKHNYTKSFKLWWTSLNRICSMMPISGLLEHRFEDTSRFGNMQQQIQLTCKRSIRHCFIQCQKHVFSIFKLCNILAVQEYWLAKRYFPASFLFTLNSMELQNYINLYDGLRGRPHFHRGDRGV